MDLDDAAPEATWQEASEVGTEVAQSAWATAAREILIDAARRYQAVVTYQELADEVVLRSGIRTKQPMRYWIGDVLTRVSTECTSRSEPLLSSLCVNATGSVGDGYGAAVQAATGDAPTDADMHAAKERLACHVHFEAPDLPSGGGTAMLTQKLASARQRQRKADLAERVVAVCPTCNTQLPATRRCDYCDE